MPTLAKVISDVRHRLAGAGAYTDMVSELREAIDATALTIPVDAAFNGAAGGVYEIGLEKVRVKSVNETDSSLTAFSFGRGYDGTVAAPHAAGSEVVHAPVFPASTVASEVNGVLHELYPSLYAVRQYEAPYTPAGFTIPAEATGVIAVYRQGDGGAGWHRLDQWRFDPDSGNGLWVKHVAAGETVRVVYGSRPGTFKLDTQVRVRRNLILDPLCTSLATWRVSDGDFISVVTDGGRSAIAVVQGAGPSLYADAATNYPVSVGDVVRFSAEVKSDRSDIAASMRLRLMAYNGAKFGTVTDVSSPLGVPEGEFTRVEVAATVTDAPPGAYVRALVWPVTAGGAAPDSDFRYRDVIVELGPQVPVDGAYWNGTDPVVGLIVSWDGPVNASTSTAIPSKSVLDDDWTSITGLPDRVADVIALGVAYRLAPFFDTARLPATGAESRADGQSKPPGAGAQASRLLLAEFTQRVQQEAAVLAKEHPIRVHRER